MITMDSKITSIAIIAVALVIVAAGAFVLLGDNGGNDDSTVEPHKVVIKDSLGNDIEIMAPVSAFCTVNTNAAEFFQMLSLDKLVVGADDATIKTLDTYKDVTNIGDYKNPVGEKVVSTGSKIVISQSSSRSLSAAAEQALKDNFGITVLRLDFYGETMLSDVESLLKIVDSKKAEKAFDEYKTTYDKVVKTVMDKASKTTGDPSFLFLFTSMSSKVGTYYNENSELGKITASIHGHNALTDMKVTSSTVTSKPSAEAVYDYDKNGDLGYVFIRGGTGDSAAKDYQTFIKTGGGLDFNGLNVVKNRNVFVINTDVLSGPRDYIGYVCIAEAFGIDTGLDYKGLVDSFNDKYGFDMKYDYIMVQFPAA